MSWLSRLSGLSWGSLRRVLRHFDFNNTVEQGALVQGSRGLFRVSRVYELHKTIAERTTSSGDNGGRFANALDGADYSRINIHFTLGCEVGLQVLVSGAKGQVSYKNLGSHVFYGVLGKYGNFSECFLTC